MIKRRTLADCRLQAGDILTVRLNQRKFGNHEKEVEVKKVIVTKQQVHAVCRLDAVGQRLSLGEGTVVVKNLW